MELHPVEFFFNRIKNYRLKHLKSITIIKKKLNFLSKYSEYV